MKLIISVLGCISIIILVSISGVAQEDSSLTRMVTVVSDESMLFNLGDFSIQGLYNGLYNEEFIASFQDVGNNSLISSYLPSDFLYNLHVFPIFGDTEITEISEITIVPESLLYASNNQDILELIDDIAVYSNVSFSLSNGMFLIGTDGSPLQYSLMDSSCFSGFLSIPFEEFGKATSFFSLSHNKSLASFSYSGNTLLVYPVSETGSINVYSSLGAQLWSNQNDKFLLLVNASEFNINESSYVHVLPLTESITPNDIVFRFSPSQQNPDILALVQQLSDNETGMDGFKFNTIPFFSNSEQQNDIVSSLSLILNGGTVFVNHSNTVIIDGINHKFESFGFTRYNQAVIHPSFENLSVSADYTLIFLGDHFYSSQATQSDEGVALPIFPIIFWMGVIACMMACYVIDKKSMRDHKEISYYIKNKKIQYLSIGVHITGYICAFYLIDFVIHYQFGISFFNELFINGATLLAGILFVVQCLLWVIGYIFSALPLGLISNKILSFIGFDASYKHFMKGAIAFSIWPMIALYATLLLNVVLLFVNPFQAMV